MDRNNAYQGLLAWMAANKVAANLLMMIIVFGGLAAALNITQEVFPEYELDIVNVSVSYPGASPEEVERGIILAMEEDIRGLDSVERVTATAREGRASLSVELLAGSNPNKSLQDIKNAVDRISSLPDEAERPLISLQSRRREVVRLAFFGDLDEQTRYQAASAIREELIGLPGITQVEMRGVRPPEIAIEVEQHLLRAHGLTLGEIARAVRERAVDVPAGGIKTSGGEVLLRTTERREFAAEFADIALLSRKSGAEVTLGEIAGISDGFAETDREASYNGKRAVLFHVYRTGDETPESVSKTVRRFVEEVAPTLPDGTGLLIDNDRSELYRDRLGLLLGNGTLGLVLVLLALGLFLEPRLAFWVSMGIPISIVGSFAILLLLGGTINMVSMFAFIITIGIVVDDAVVVGENIFHKRQAGMEPLAAAVAGVREMAAPVLVAVATNILAFLPMLTVSGSTGRFFAVLPAVVISVFLISLLECLFVLPAHLAYPHREAGKGPGTLTRISRRCAVALERFVATCFAPVLRFSVANRYLVSAGALAILLVAYAYWDSGWINFSFRPQIQTDSIDVEIELPYGSPFAEVKRVAGLVEEGGLRVVEKSGGRGILVGARTDIGGKGSNTAEITFTLVPQKERAVTTKEFSSRWRREVGEIAGLEKLFFDYVVGPGGSSAINIELTHPDHRILEQAATDTAGALAGFSGVTDINDGFARGKPQLDFTMRPEGRSLGLTSRELGSQVRHAFYGAEALRQQRGRDEIKVMVRLPQAERQSLYNLEQLLIRTPSGGEIPLGMAATVTNSRAYTEINRVDGRRVLNVTANVVPGVANENKVLAGIRSDFMPLLLAKYPGLGSSFEGQQREQRIAMRDLFRGILFVLPGIFCLLAIPLRSYGLALLVMTSIPFGMVAALAGHVLMGYELSIISVFGMIALCGVVVNGGLVFTITANELHAGGATPGDAACQASVRRFRPILLTAFTTFAGLAPMIFEQSVQARFLIPMAISLGYGILFSTAVSLLLMPALFVIYHDCRRLGR
jgi:multidrug efflux pump subunit AcrB